MGPKVLISLYFGSCQVENHSVLERAYVRFDSLFKGPEILMFKGIHDLFVLSAYGPVMLQEVTGRARNRIYRANEVMKTIEDPLVEGRGYIEPG